MKKLLLLTLFSFAFLCSVWAVKQPTINGLDRSASYKNNAGTQIVYDADWLIVTPDAALLDNGDGTATLTISGTLTSSAELDPKWTAVKYDFVPYRSATGSVFLGNYDIDARYVTGSTVYATGPVISAPNQDEASTLGRWRIGYDGVTADFAYLSHYDMFNANDFALLQENDGDTWVNAPSTKFVFLSNNGTQFARFRDDEINFHDTPIKIGNAWGSEDLDIARDGPRILTLSSAYGDATFWATGSIVATNAVTSSIVYATSAVFTGGITASAPIIYLDDRGYSRNLGQLSTTLAEMETNTLLDKSRSTLSASGGVLTYTLYAINGTGRWDFDGIVYTGSVPSATVNLTAGTDLVPVTNYVYFELVGGVPTLKATTTEPTTSHIDVATFKIGAVSGSNFTIYAYLRNRSETETFINRTIERFEHAGSLYISGLAPSATASVITVTSSAGTPGRFFVGAFEMYATGAVATSTGYNFINSAGEFINSVSIADLSKYSDGTSLGANERQNIVWGVVPTSLTNGGTNPTNLKLMAILQSKPASVYVTDIAAEQDVYGATNFYPPDDDIKKAFVPVARTIVRPSVPSFQQFGSGAYYQDIRGKISTSGGVTSIPLETDPIWSGVKPNYVTYTGATGSVVLGNYDLSSRYATGLIVYATNSIVQNTSTSAVVCVNASGGAYYLPYTKGATGQVITLQTDGNTKWQTPATSTSGSSSVSGSIVAVFDGGGSAISTGSTIWVSVPVSFTITEWAIQSFTTSPILKVDVWKTSYNGFNSATGPSIAGSEIPTLTAQQKNRDQSLSTWTTSLSAQDYVYFTVASVDTATKAVVTLYGTK